MPIVLKPPSSGALGGFPNPVLELVMPVYKYLFVRPLLSLEPPSLSSFFCDRFFLSECSKTRMFSIWWLASFSVQERCAIRHLRLFADFPVVARSAVSPRPAPSHPPFPIFATRNPFFGTVLYLPSRSPCSRNRSLKFRNGFFRRHSRFSAPIPFLQSVRGVCLDRPISGVLPVSEDVLGR